MSDSWCPCQLPARSENRENDFGSEFLNLSNDFHDSPFRAQTHQRQLNMLRFSISPVSRTPCPTLFTASVRCQSEVPKCFHDVGMLACATVARCQDRSTSCFPNSLICENNENMLTVKVVLFFHTFVNHFMLDVRTCTVSNIKCVETTLKQ